MYQVYCSTDIRPRERSSVTGSLTLKRKCHTHRHTNTHTRMYACTHARTHTRTQTHTHTHTYTHTHTHTHTNTQKEFRLLYIHTYTQRNTLILTCVLSSLFIERCLQSNTYNQRRTGMMWNARERALYVAELCTMEHDYSL